MTSLEERIYELGAGALVEQERLVAETRTRGATIIAAAALIGSLLVGPALRRGHPSNGVEFVAALVGLAGCGGVLVFVVLLRPRELAFGVRPTATYRSLWDRGTTEPPMSDIALAGLFEKRQENNRPTVERLTRLLTLALGSLILETAGLALAAAVTS